MRVRHHLRYPCQIGLALPRRKLASGSRKPARPEEPETLFARHSICSSGITSSAGLSGASSATARTSDSWQLITASNTVALLRLSKVCSRRFSIRRPDLSSRKTSSMHQRYSLRQRVPGPSQRAHGRDTGPRFPNMGGRFAPSCLAITTALTTSCVLAMVAGFQSADSDVANLGVTVSGGRAILRTDDLASWTRRRIRIRQERGISD